MAEIAVLGCTVEITSGQVAGAKVITTPPSSEVFIDNKGAYFGDIDVLLTTLSQGSYTVASATITIKGSGSKVLNSDDKKAVLKGDSGSQVVTLTDSSTGATITPTVTVQITDAGQTGVIAT